MPTPSEWRPCGFSITTSSMPSSYRSRRSSRLIVRVVSSRASNVATPSSTRAVRGASATGSARPRASYEIARSPTAATLILPRVRCQVDGTGAAEGRRAIYSPVGQARACQVAPKRKGGSRGETSFPSAQLALPHQDLALVGVVRVDLVVDELADRDLLGCKRDEVVGFVEHERLRGELVLRAAQLVLRHRDVREDSVELVERLVHRLLERGALHHLLGEVHGDDLRVALGHEAAPGSLQAETPHAVV